jgi:hypothetical protein
MPIHIPATQQIVKAMEVAQASKEGADYLVGRMRKILTDAKVIDKSSELMARVEEFATHVSYKLSKSTQPWFGQSAWETDYKNMQDNLAKDMATRLLEAGVEGDLHLDFAISNKAEIVMGYSSEGKPLKSNEEQYKLFNAWLATQNVVSKGSILYKADTKGNILSDQGNVAEHAAQIRQLITDEQKGLSKFMQEKGLPPISTQQHNYPSPSNAEQPKKLADEESTSTIRTK